MWELLRSEQKLTALHRSFKRGSRREPKHVDQCSRVQKWAITLHQELGNCRARASPIGARNACFGSLGRGGLYCRHALSLPAILLSDKLASSLIRVPLFSPEASPRSPFQVLQKNSKICYEIVVNSSSGELPQVVASLRHHVCIAFAC